MVGICRQRGDQHTGGTFREANNNLSILLTPFVPLVVLLPSRSQLMFPVLYSPPPRNKHSPQPPIRTHRPCTHCSGRHAHSPDPHRLPPPTSLVCTVWGFPARHVQPAALAAVQALRGGQANKPVMSGQWRARRYMTLIWGGRQLRQQARITQGRSSEWLKGRGRGMSVFSWPSLLEHTRHPPLPVPGCRWRACRASQQRDPPPTRSCRQIRWCK